MAIKVRQNIEMVMGSDSGQPRSRILCIVPPTGRFIREDRCQTPIEKLKTVALRPPIDLLYAAGSFEAAGCEVRLKDYPGEELGWGDLENELREFDPQLILLSITTPSLARDLEAAALAKRVKPGILTVAKGAHFNTLDEDALHRYANLDMVLRGEFEPACRSLAQGVPWEQIPGLTYREADGRIVRTADPGYIEELDSLPYPARHLAHNALYVRPDTGEIQTTIVTNRGCPFSCIYCLANQVGGRRNRMRSVENILGEIEQCVERYGIRSFLFRSDTFTANRQWVIDLCRQIRERNLDIAWVCNSRVDTLDAELLAEMKAAHCWMIAFGIESGSEEMLRHIGKKADLDTACRTLSLTRQAGIASSVYFMVGFPWETRQTLQANERFARELDPDFLEVFYPYPFPGTQLHQEVVRLGLVPRGEIPRQAYDRPAMAGLNLSREELAEARGRLLRSFYLRPRVIWRTLRRVRSWREMVNYVRYGWLQFKELF
jgi:radical SAM superfamily enzyme YgiQ (UPF0313 family)